MYILEQRFLRGPNIHADSPCLLSVLDLDDLYGVSSKDIPGFNDALLALLPSLHGQLVPTGQRGGFAQRLREGTYLGRVVEQLTLELQTLAGTHVSYGRTNPAARRPGHVRIVCAYEVESVAQPAFRLAVQIADALGHGQPFDLGPRLAELREIVARHAIDPGTAAVLAAAHERGVPVQRLTEDASLFQLGWGVKQRRLQAGATSETSFVAAKIASDKQLARSLLQEAGVPVPQGDVVRSLDEALEVARWVGGPVTVKPLDAGEGVSVNCSTRDDIERAYALAHNYARRIIVERAVEGSAYRVLVAGGRVVSARRVDKGSDAGQDVTGLLPEPTRRLCVRAAATVGLDVAGIDIVCRDISQPLAAQGGAVIEVNAGSDIALQQHPDAGAAVLDSLMGDSNGRIPLVAVTGTNGKTTTALMIAHAARMAGRVTGVTTTHGVYINGKTVAVGDCTGYWSARTVLAAPDVEFAVLETARGGILKRGLAFDRCDVGVVLNVSPDHLGLDGVETIEDLAQVKTVVAASASRAAVLNAQDALCVAMVRRLKPNTEVVFFSMEPENPVLLKHLGDGGRGAYLQDNAIVLADGKRQVELLRVESMPAAFGGLARFNIANALAAAAALMACGFLHMQIARGLSTFVSDGKTNPLRTNVFDVRGVTVIVDYAHNPAAYVAMAEMARAMLPRQLVGIVTAPGDRRDEDLLEIGEVCGERFDELVVYDSSLRGRAPGETVDLILEGAEEVVGPSDTLHRELDVGNAIRLGLSLCAPGDVLVFSCGSSLRVFIEALRVTDPESADLIAAQTA
ncbi:Mur ligase family protein [Massilia agilis]|uniref:Mur ligase family protein n=1 Tax=Massilia agilis TaxID=1811226 RepID=A0ABT2D8Y3_9BURK|nr:Mur ligase family protein [Massilia agilis]